MHLTHAQSARSHLNLTDAPACSALNHLTLHYGMRHVGMDFDLALFGMKLSDCRSLARCLEYCETLVSLDLSNNFLDDDKLRMLASGLINNFSVVEIDLSDNRIADRGARAFAKLLHANSPLQVISLDNNQARVLLHRLIYNLMHGCVVLRHHLVLLDGAAQSLSRPCACKQDATLH